MIKRLWNNQYIPRQISLDYRHVPMKLKTAYVLAENIPLELSWRAYWEPGDGRHTGWGATEEEAIEDLKRLDEEREEAEEEKQCCTIPNTILTK